ncbi:hypothetical protein [Longispora albida]|uniref:hypothetical protein n=1 Tax=Longispora albida TaxID=203523 RepID=UPI0003722A47|nr:hypothetical protein [Longispora albida]
MNGLIGRMIGSAPQWTVYGMVAAPREQVSELLLEISPGQVSAANALILASETGLARTVTGGPGWFRAQADGRDYVELETDPAKHLIAAQGWFGGVHFVESYGSGSLIVHSVHNVRASHPEFVAGVAHLGMQARMWRDLERVLNVAGERLGCPVELSKVA